MLYPKAAEDLAAAEVRPRLAIADPGLDIDAERRAQVDEALEEERPALPYVRDVDAGGVRCRVYRPHPAAPMLLFVHGGGWVFGDLDTHDRFARELAQRTGWAVVAVGYRRAPEHPYPASLDDVQTALRWAYENAAEHDIDASLVVGAGDSSGANLIAGLCVREPDALAYQVLAYPPLDPACDPTVFRSFETEDDAVLPAAEMRWYWEAYTPTRALRRQPDAAPMYVEDLSRMPPTLLITAEHDILRDEGEAFAARLADAGVDVVGQRSLGMSHGFWRRPWDFDSADATLDHLTGTLARIRRAAA